MPEALQKQHETQLDAFKNEYMEALSKQWAATKQELSDLQESIVSDDDNSISESIKDSGMVEETLGLIPKYFLDEYLSGWFWGWLTGPLFLKGIFDKETFQELKGLRQEMRSLKDKIGTDSFDDDLWTLKGKYLDGSDFDYSDTVVYNDIVDILGKDIKYFSQIESSPYESSPTSTLCSATVQKNAQNIFGITIPSGNAIDAQNLDLDTTKKDANGRTIPVDTREAFIGSAVWSDSFLLIPTRATMADVFVESSNKNGHRCLAFKKLPTNEWYILDPYRSPDTRSVKPKKLADYTKNNKIVKVNFYDTNVVIASDSYENSNVRMVA